ncbi:hypothetical protein [Streptomyces sp. H27-D2]|uniref:hypothetical protein n=1 Tax=Streptomyces sp. H27-D2 TaxID=3046304 RepID=UPI002DBA59CA|nr:hypothetical protein [Streptomyces sp. H27-D2]MEC4016205.1 hypothetical protein [Streptomyces sp. H27-D2]
MSFDRSRTAYAESAADLARSALDALRGVGGVAMVAAHVEGADDGAAALAAVRVVGADTFAPHLFVGAALHPRDAAAVAKSFTVFPPPEGPPQPPPTGLAEPWVMAWRDWATASMLARFTAVGEVDPLHAPQPPGAPLLAEHAGLGVGPGTARPAVAEEPAAAGSSSATAPGLGWAEWSVRMGQLSSLALPGLDGPVHAAARRAPLALARGATRSLLRRDYPTAARIARWLALLQHEGVSLPLDPVPLVVHLRVLGCGPRIALDTAISGTLLGLEPV